MKKIIIDLETSNTSVFKAKVLEFCALFIENNQITEEYTRKIAFDLKYEDCDKSTISALNFNKIYSQKDIEEHNKHSISEKKLLEEFLLKVQHFGKVSITGWNNAMYDNTLLRRIIEENGYNFIEFFHYHARDIMCQFQPIWEKIFIKEFDLNLKNTHQYLFKYKLKDEKFHHANYDCYATLDLDIWIENLYEKIASIAKVKINNNN